MSWPSLAGSTRWDMYTVCTSLLPRVSNKVRAGRERTVPPAMLKIYEPWPIEECWEYKSSFNCAPLLSFCKYQIITPALPEVVVFNALVMAEPNDLHISSLLIYHRSISPGKTGVKERQDTLSSDGSWFFWPSWNYECDFACWGSLCRMFPRM